MPNIETEKGLECTCRREQSFTVGDRDTSCRVHGDDAYVIRYATYVRCPFWDSPSAREAACRQHGGRYGSVWKLVHPMQGRYMRKTREEAEICAAGMVENNSKEKLMQIFGCCEREDFRVFPVECWPGHCDPKGCYHWEPD